MEYGLRRARTVVDAKAAMELLFKAKFPLSPELQNRSPASLFLSVFQLLPGSEQQRSEKAMNFIRRLEKAELSLQAETDDNDKLDSQQRDQM